MHRKLTIFVFIFYFLMLIPPASAGQTLLYTTINGSYVLRPSGMDINHNLGTVHYAFTLLTGTYVTSPGHPVCVYYRAKVWGFKQQGGQDNDYKFKDMYIEFQIIGPKTITFKKDVIPTWSSDGYGTVDLYYSTASIGYLYEFSYDNTSSGVYFWKITIMLHYTQQPLLGDTINYYLKRTIEVSFSDLVILKYKETGDWATDLANGGSTAFSTIWTIWSTAGSKILNLDWEKIVDLDVLGFIGDIITMLTIVGYTIFEMFTVPVTSISIMMQYSTNVYTISFFIIEVVGVFIVSSALLWVMWKLIMLLKP